jgi:twitching motility protein PilU
MEKSMVPGAQTFEQSLVDLYRKGLITLDEALSNADSANNLQQVINNTAAATDPATTTAPAEQTRSVAPGTSFSEFTLKMDPDQ